MYRRGHNTRYLGTIAIAQHWETSKSYICTRHSGTSPEMPQWHHNFPDLPRPSLNTDCFPPEHFTAFRASLKAKHRPLSITFISYQFAMQSAMASASLLQEHSFRRAPGKGFVARKIRHNSILVMIGQKCTFFEALASGCKPLMKGFFVWYLDPFVESTLILEISTYCLLGTITQYFLLGIFFHTVLAAPQGSITKGYLDPTPMRHRTSCLLAKCSDMHACVPIEHFVNPAMGLLFFLARIYKIQNWISKEFPG